MWILGAIGWFVFIPKQELHSILWMELVAQQPQTKFLFFEGMILLKWSEEHR